MLPLDSLVQRLARPGSFAVEGDGTGRRAAVAAVLRPDGGAGELLFIERAQREGDPWSGHMAFPGGRREPTDRLLIDTAIRETNEEVGLDLGALARPLARLPDLRPFSAPGSLTVTAFVFLLERPAALRCNEEVAAVVWASLDAVLRGEPATRFRWSRDGKDMDFPALDVQGHVVWGLTYRMIELLREAVTR